MQDSKPPMNSPKRGSLEWYDLIETEAQIKAAEAAAESWKQKAKQPAK